MGFDISLVAGILTTIATSFLVQSTFSPSAKSLVAVILAIAIGSVQVVLSGDFSASNIGFSIFSIAGVAWAVYLGFGKTIGGRFFDFLESINTPVSELLAKVLGQLQPAPGTVKVEEQNKG